MPRQSAALQPHRRIFADRRRNPDGKRGAVLHTAVRMFLERSYGRTSMNDVAMQLNITKPALYHYFRNKEEILVECYRLGIAAIEGLLDKAAVSQGNGLNKVRAYVEAYAKAVVTHDFGRCVAMLDDAELSPKARREVRDLKRKIDMAIRGYVEEGIADGSVAPCNAKLASFALAGAVNWIGTWYRPEGALGAEEIATQFADLLTQGLRGCDAKPAVAKKARAAKR